MLEFKNGEALLQTTAYEIIEISQEEKQIQEFIDFNSGLLRRMFTEQDTVPLSEFWRFSPLTFRAIYPANAAGEKNDENTVNGILRVEELMTFASQDGQGNIVYLTRSRPKWIGINTPWELDPGVFSHGGLKQAGVVNGWRFVADKLWLDDSSLDEDSYREYLEKNPFPKVKKIVNLWSFIIANGSNARNEKNKREWKELEPRTSWMIHVRALIINDNDFERLLKEQNRYGNSIQYSSVKLSDTSSFFTPKHEATHRLLQKLASMNFRVQSSVPESVIKILSV